MNIRLPYKPTHSVEWLEKHLSENYYKKSYDRFMWWRSYTTKKTPLTNRHPLRDRILNGDFDYGSFKYEAELVEHRMNEKYKELHNDSGRYVQETSLDRARRKRLLEDYEKDEAKKLEELKKAFTTYRWRLTRNQYDEEVLNFDGDELIDFYFYIEEKYSK